MVSKRKSRKSQDDDIEGDESRKAAVESKSIIKKEESKRPGISRQKDRIRSKNVVKMN